MKTKISIFTLVIGLAIIALAKASPSASGSASVAAGTVSSQNNNQMNQTVYHVQPYTNWLYVDTNSPNNSPNVSTNRLATHHWWKQ